VYHPGVEGLLTAAMGSEWLAANRGVGALSEGQLMALALQPSSSLNSPPLQSLRTLALGPSMNGSGAVHAFHTAPGMRLVACGPRVTVGVDVGAVTAELHPTTGRLTYRGKVLNRAARTANKAGPSQVGGVLQHRVPNGFLQP
jgi:hypothetical protein